jgi:hypothetical protein
VSGIIDGGRGYRVELFRSSQKKLGVVFGTKQGRDISIAEILGNVMDDRVTQNVVFTTLEIAAPDKCLIRS